MLQVIACNKSKQWHNENMNPMNRIFVSKTCFWRTEPLQWSELALPSLRLQAFAVLLYQRNPEKALAADGSDRLRPPCRTAGVSDRLRLLVEPQRRLWPLMFLMFLRPPCRTRTLAEHSDVSASEKQTFYSLLLRTQNEIHNKIFCYIFLLKQKHPIFLLKQKHHISVSVSALWRGKECIWGGYISHLTCAKQLTKT